MDQKIINSLIEFNKVTPLILCGVARSGTRMMTDILNNHTNIVIQEEIHAKTAEAFFDLITKIDLNFEEYGKRQNKTLGDHWHNHKHILAHSFFATANKRSLQGKNKTILYHGVKTPGYERYYPIFESLFTKTPPRYIYNIRDIGKVWRSWKSIGFLSDVNIFKTRYERSLRQAIKLKRLVGNRCVIFDLDRYITSCKKEQFIIDEVFSKLELDICSGFLMNVEKLNNNNSLQNRGFNYIDDEIIENEIIHLQKCNKIKDYKNLLTSL